MTHYKKYFVLFVDDEPNALKYFEKAFSQYFQILTAENAAEGWKIIQERCDDIGILMTDQRMPGEPGVKLLEKVRKSYPQIIRILVTAYADLDSAIAAVNSGAIYKYISKPWDLNELQISLMRAFDFFMVQNERDQLVQEKMSVIQRMYMANQEKNLACFAAGMAPIFKNSLQAVQQYIDLIPIPQDNEKPNGSSWRKMENWGSLEVQNISYMLANIRKSCEESPYNLKPETLSLHKVAERVHSSSENERKLICRFDPKIPEIQLHETQIIYLFELMRENIQFVSNKESEVIVTAGNYNNSNGIEMVQLEFSDNSDPWSEEQRNQFIALPTQTNKNKSGLNLLICMLIVHNHNGEIEVISGKDKKVMVKLPLALGTLQPDRDLFEKKILNRILYNEKNWNYF